MDRRNFCPVIAVQISEGSVLESRATRMICGISVRHIVRA
ncbi:hypothetical protein D3OALGA1CA_1139 [Olavius algarvensis associated proteobacterium Delta 3]|nr:hypothetical protein D3OALGB2SA_1147 [Olavius algarvensis associated proteobacterium Delta 3]CAB5094906.1 hypothetical protein D3OALGA1CA_1139 [Olavius algarvensis associated proteobacterium Delta 3]